MDKNFAIDKLEPFCRQLWAQQNQNQPQNQHNPSKNYYTILLPPPNVTGSLHMGHAFQQTIMDCLIRFKQMNGFNSHLQVGLDHSGIATQMIVERLLEQDGIKKHSLGREGFIAKVWEWKQQSGGRILEQMQLLGVTTDWDRQRFTMDADYCKAVVAAFVKLYDDNLIYRRKKLVNWDTKLKTAISDLEVLNVEKKGKLWYLLYPLEKKAGHKHNNISHLQIATTRPETMLGDVAVAVHPDDARYKGLVGYHIILPISGRKIPIIADSYVDAEFGTGCVKITPAHDFNDYAIAQKHQLDMINILTESGEILADAEVYAADGKITGNIELPEEVKGLTVKAAREQVVAKMQSLDLLAKVVEHNLKVPLGDRSQTVIEPLLTDQWFVNAKQLAKQAIAVVETGDIEFVPSNYKNMYYAWMHNIDDWCISRQLWWGHQIPAWYDADGNIYVGSNEATVRAKYKLAAAIKLTRDESVLDTWFSSGLWSFATLSDWPNINDELQNRHPTDVLVTGFDIIFFWVARMIMLSLYFTGEVPFKKVYVTGLIKDENGQKMSKSKGNVIDPIDMINGIELQPLLEKTIKAMMQPQLATKVQKSLTKKFPDGIQAHGTDALRLTLLALASTGRDINWDMQRLNGFRNFCNKLWNAGKFVLTSAQEPQNIDTIAINSLHPINLWILHKLNATIDSVNKNIAIYRFDELIRILQDFIWHQFCDWYIELAKILINDQNLQKQTETVLIYTYYSILKLLSPFAPYVTETINTELHKKFPAIISNEILVKQSWAAPIVMNRINTQAIANDIELFQEIVTQFRSIKAENNIAPKTRLQLQLATENIQNYQILLSYKALLLDILKLDALQINNEVLSTNKLSNLDAVAKLGDITLTVALEGLVDTESELKRLKREGDKITKNIDKLQTKLNNKQYTANAPAQLVARDVALLAELQKKSQQIK